eukprot:TRINITY_DN26578_c0_g1_i1.p1 TRINITY_DN26578_c0_g1~~TRINITY_DN26578_c0_g1_i1.p1  ORF type:complete len:445 (+),score=37.51 TRINITY_DN26578_c0_g1_i1:53-1387(+)
MLTTLWNTLFGSRGQSEQVTPLTEDEGRHMPVVSHYDYAVLSEHVYGDTVRLLPKGWEVFLESEELSLDREGFKATAYVHHEMRQVVVAQRGTIDAAGLRAGIWVYFDEPTIQFMLSEQFSKIVRLKLSLQHKDDYIVSYTGHSLGGVLATCRAVAEHTFGVVFEPPGCKGFVEKIMHPFRWELADIIVYVRPPNTINCLKQQVGHVVQLPPKEYHAPNTTIVEENIQKKISQMLPSVSFPNVGEFMGKKILEKSVPELYDYLSKIEPIVRELFDETQQVHSIHNIVPLFEDEKGRYCEPESETVLVWPTHIMQFAEYRSALKGLEEVTDSEPHLKAAYTSLLERLHVTKKRHRQELALAWLDTPSLRLLQWWVGLSEHQQTNPPIPLTHYDRRVLASARISRDMLKTTGCTAFQMKQYLFILSRKPVIRSFISNIPETPISKL